MNIQIIPVCSQSDEELLYFPYEMVLIQSLKQKYGLSEVSEEDFVRFVKTRMVAFFDVKEWMNYIRSFDFVVGTRFHGCLIALLNRIPCIVFVHDSRTREMCELLNIPHIRVEKVREINLGTLYESMDLNALEVAYSYLYQNYIDFLEENGIEHCLLRTDKGSKNDALQT